MAGEHGGVGQVRGMVGVSIWLLCFEGWMTVKRGSEARNAILCMTHADFTGLLSGVFREGAILHWLFLNPQSVQGTVEAPCGATVVSVSGKW